MNKELIKNELQWLLEAINEQYDAIHSYDEKVPHIEFDILMDNVRKFYENMFLLQRLNDPHFSFEKIGKSRGGNKMPHGEPLPSPVIKEQTPPGVETLAKQDVPAAERVVKQVIPEVETVAKQDVPEVEKVVKQVEQDVVSTLDQPAQFKPVGPVKTQSEPYSIPKKHARSQEIDLFAAEEPTFNIKLKDAREKIFSPRIPSERIQNLKSAISINEKFMFINELFEGNLREYNETIETLNGFKNLDQAADFLDLMRKKNFWDTGSNAFKKLKELLERRY